MFKKRNLIALGILAITSFVSLLGLSNHHVKEAKAEEGTVETTRFIFNGGTVDWTVDNAVIKFGATDSSGKRNNLDTTRFGTTNIWYSDVEVSKLSDLKSFAFYRMKSNLSEDWNHTKEITLAEGETYASYTIYNQNANGKWTDNGDWYKSSDWVIKGGREGDWTTKPISVPMEEQYDDSNLIQIVKTNVELKKGDLFKINNNSAWWGFSNIEDVAQKALSSYLKKASSDNNIEVIADIDVDIYFKILEHTIWIEKAPEQVAKEFATKFLDKTGTVCDDGSTSDDHSVELAKVWTDLKSTFTSMSLAAQDAFLNSSKDETVVDARARYNHIVARYGSVFDFKAEASSLNPAINRINTNDIMLMVVLSTATVISMAAIIYLLTKKKRLHQ